MNRNQNIDYKAENNYGLSLKANTYSNRPVSCAMRLLLLSYRRIESSQVESHGTTAFMLTKHLCMKNCKLADEGEWFNTKQEREMSIIKIGTKSSVSLLSALLKNTDGFMELIKWKIDRNFNMRSRNHIRPSKIRPHLGNAQHNHFANKDKKNIVIGGQCSAPLALMRTIKD
ncbi:CLUMA_CG001357, isoform A [Clunio marinus]|uniref:CLUMA_CG001357, isoform A n=1 Tax=Clunio marinus TaxID=568069 RepID=A0A1J1HHP8_9DIPT|nr:CLUMA_CG001357, isoform A [Clunio marinus]